MCISLPFMCLISHLQEAESYPEKSCFPGEEYFQGRIEGQHVNVRTEGHIVGFLRYYVVGIDALVSRKGSIG